MLGPDQRFSTVSSQSVARRLRAQRGGQPLTILALSGGGADGAFGAGALVGLTRSATRPTFSVVTGVSTGALIAPYAFLGPAWDDQLIEVYTSGRAEHLLQSRGLGAFFGSSLYRGEPLKELVDRYATDELIRAVAHEASTGRLLLVATTDVGTGEPVVWDLGSIAMNGGPGARLLFRDVLVASASVPGLFPPVVIRVRQEQALFEEVHVDGTTTVPFLVPLAFIEPSEDAGNRSHHAAVYIIVDGRLSEQPASIRLRTRSILSRSVSTGLNHMFRTTLELTATDAALEGAQFQFAAIPAGYPQPDPFDFRTRKHAISVQVRLHVRPSGSAMGFITRRRQRCSSNPHQRRSGSEHTLPRRRCVHWAICRALRFSLFVQERICPTKQILPANRCPWRTTALPLPGPWTGWGIAICLRGR